MKLLFSLGLLCMLVACDDDAKQNEDITNDVNKDGSVETSVAVKHVDSLRDVVVTTHKVWYLYNEWKTIVHYDTVPALGATHKIAENEAGDEKMVSLQKEYEIFITVK
jgi:hypothetical protein